MINSITLKPREERRLLRGHHWVYRNELADVTDLADGSLVEVRTAQGRVVGTGFAQRAGSIAVRLLTRSAGFDTGIFRQRIAHAQALRAQLYPNERVYRLIFGESDGLPAFVADRYGPVISARAASRFYLDHAGVLAQALMEHTGCMGVLLKFEEHVLQFGDTPDPVECICNGLKLSVDIVHGQKTGMFLDQRQNWPLVRPFAKGARVLDGYCYAGAWACHAAAAGARTVVGVDTSGRALERARANAVLNGVQGKCTFIESEIQDYFKGQKKFDVVILDPPALAKAKTHLRKALRLYQALNTAAMNALERGGILITSSCSQPVDEASFLESLKRAANGARRQPQVLGIYGAAPDHPALLAMPESRYLSCVVLRIL